MPPYPTRPLTAGSAACHGEDASARWKNSRLAEVDDQDDDRASTTCSVDAGTANRWTWSSDVPAAAAAATGPVSGTTSALSTAARTSQTRCSMPGTLRPLCVPFVPIPPPLSRMKGTFCAHGRTKTPFIRRP